MQFLTVLTIIREESLCRISFTDVSGRRRNDVELISSSNPIIGYSPTIRNIRLRIRIAGLLLRLPIVDIHLVLNWKSSTVDPTDRYTKRSIRYSRHPAILLPLPPLLVVLLLFLLLLIVKSMIIPNRRRRYRIILSVFPK